MDFRETFYLFAGVFSFFILSVVPLQATDKGTQMLVKSGGVEIEVFEFGKGPETLIMAAGNGRPAAQLDKLAEGIAANGIRVITYNYRSLGASTGPIEGLTLHDYANDLWRVADALGLKKVHLAGKTYGNRVVRAASQDKPDRVLSVILIGAGGAVPPSAETMALYKRYTDPNIPKDEWLKLQGQLMYAPGHENLAAVDAEQASFLPLPLAGPSSA
jgi:pimeloyl-ACP methyl ester carboxylesterase